MWFRRGIHGLFAVLLALGSTTAADAAVDAKQLAQNQTIRDTLFKNLKDATTEYSFDYVVIFLPAGSLPGINAVIPVSHIRFNSTVFFAFGKSSLEDSAEPPILALAKNVLADRSARSVLVVGHTDAIGTDEFNAYLSLRRAVSVASRLKELGVSEKLLGVVPMGEAQPAATNRTSDGRAKNRRVEFFISDIPEATRKAIELIKFNPCHRNDQDVPPDQLNPECDRDVHVPVFAGTSGRGQPEIMLDLGRRTLSTGSIPLIRTPLPHDILQRPSLKNLSSD